MTMRTRIATAALILASLPMLQACFPVAVVGTGAAALMVADRRTSGIYLEDEGIELKVLNRISERFRSSVHINATSYNRNLLLTGEAPTAAIREEIGRMAAAVENVRSIANEIQLATNSTLASRSNDTYLTSKVKARIIDANQFPAHVVKVVTENSTVYLMGIVTQKEADKAAEVASTTGGVRRVVRVFEYITREKAVELDNRTKAAPSSNTSH